MHHWFSGSTVRRELLRVGCVCIASLLAGCPPPSPVPSGDTVALSSVAEGLTSPVTMAVPPDGTKRRFIVDQVGVVWIIREDGSIHETPFLDIRNRMDALNPTYDERGLLGMAFHPQYADNQRFFVMYNAPPGDDAPEGSVTELHISELRTLQADPNMVDANSERVLLRIPKPQFNHNGGMVAFGPDGYLYISVGDGGGANDTGPGHTPDIGNGQDLSTRLGKILRIDVDVEDQEPYAIPPDNPFVDVTDAAPEIWALGLRNPYRMSFDRGGDRRLFAGDVGQDLFEEVNIITRGGNYGWFIREASSCFNPDDPGGPLPACADVGPSGVPLTDPVIEYPQSGPGGALVGVAVIGGYVYRGSAIPALQGQYIFGDLSSTLAITDGVLLVSQEADDGTWDVRELQVADQPDGRVGRLILGFGEDADGELYVMTTENLGPVGQTGVVYRIDPAP